MFVQFRLHECRLQLGFNVRHKYRSVHFSHVAAAFGRANTAAHTNSHVVAAATAAFGRANTSANFHVATTTAAAAKSDGVPHTSALSAALFTAHVPSLSAALSAAHTSSLSAALSAAHTAALSASLSASIRDPNGDTNGSDNIWPNNAHRTALWPALASPFVHTYFHPAGVHCFHHYADLVEHHTHCVCLVDFDFNGRLVHQGRCENFRFFRRDCFRVGCGNCFCDYSFAAKTDENLQR